MTIRTAIYHERPSPSPSPPTNRHATCGNSRLIADGLSFAVHRDNAPVGGKSAERRSGLTALLSAIKAGSYDVVIVERLNLIGHDLPALVMVLSAMKAENVRLIARLENIDTAGAEMIC